MGCSRKVWQRMLWLSNRKSYQRPQLRKEIGTEATDAQGLLALTASNSRACVAEVED
jgi:hypothetical protein